MGRYTKVVNRKYANVGDVKITFDDYTSVTHTINSIDSGDGDSPSVGTYFDENSSRTPISIEALNGKWDMTDLPASITYSDSDTGTMEYIETDTYQGIFQTVYLDEQ